MRQVKREITDLPQIELVIAKAEVCRLGLYSDDFPYVVPLNFGYAKQCFYFHCALEGKKLELIRKDNRVCIELEAEAILDPDPDLACKWGTQFKSVIAYGHAFILEDPGEKREALNILMQHYTGEKSNWEYPDEHLNKMVAIKVVVRTLTGKQSVHYTRLR